MTKSMLAGAAVAAATILCGGRSSAATFDADTLGFWTFDGENGSTFEGTVPNLVAGATMVLEATTTNAAGKTVYSPMYTNDVPTRYVFSDYAMTNLIGEMKASVHLRRGSVNTVASILRIPEFGKAVLDAEGNCSDFTIEVVMRPSETDNTNPNLMGISGANPNKSPMAMIGSSRTNGGYFGSLNSETATAVNGALKSWLGSNANLRTPLPTTSEWRHITLQYRHSTRQLRAVFDYHDTGSSSAVTFPSGTDIELALDSIFTILGGLGKHTVSHPSANVAAVRVTKRYLTEKEMLQVADKQVPDVLVHCRFTGPCGGQAKRIPNLVDNKMAGLTAIFANSTETFTNDTASTRGWMKTTFPAKDFWENPAAATSVTNADGRAAKTSCALTMNPAFLYGSFTCEMFVKSLAHAGNGTPLFGPHGEANNWGVSFNTAGTSRLRLYSQKKADGTTGSVEVYSGNVTEGSWHHVAVTYDAVTRKMLLYVDYTSKPASYTCVEGWDPWTPNNASKTFSLSVTGGFNMSAEGSLYGLLDEFRFTRGVLTPDQFIHPSGGPGVLMLLR